MPWRHYACAAAARKPGHMCKNNPIVSSELMVSGYSACMLYRAYASHHGVRALIRRQHGDASALRPLDMAPLLQRWIFCVRDKQFHKRPIPTRPAKWSG